MSTLYPNRRQRLTASVVAAAKTAGHPVAKAYHHTAAAYHNRKAEAYAHATARNFGKQFVKDCTECVPGEEMCNYHWELWKFHARNEISSILWSAACAHVRKDEAAMENVHNEQQLRLAVMALLERDGLSLDQTRTARQLRDEAQGVSYPPEYQEV
jgi:hypothetical protein